MLTYEELKNKPRELLAATGLKRAEIEKLLEVFRQEYAKAYPTERTIEGKARKRRQGGGNKGVLKGRRTNYCGSSCESVRGN